MQNIDFKEIIQMMVVVIIALIIYDQMVKPALPSKEEA